MYAFLEVVFHFVSSIVNIHFFPTKYQFLFGFLNEEWHSVNNFLSLLLKKFIWLNKFKSKTLDLRQFKNLLKSYLCDFKYIFTMIDKPELFTKWETIYNAI